MLGASIRTLGEGEDCGRRECQSVGSVLDCRRTREVSRVGCYEDDQCFGIYGMGGSFGIFKDKLTLALDVLVVARALFGLGIPLPPMFALRVPVVVIALELEFALRVIVALSFVATLTPGVVRILDVILALVVVVVVARSLVVTLVPIAVGVFDVGLALVVVVAVFIHAWGLPAVLVLVIVFVLVLMVIVVFLRLPGRFGQWLAAALEIVGSGIDIVVSGHHEIEPAGFELSAIITDRLHHGDGSEYSEEDSNILHDLTICSKYGRIRIGTKLDKMKW